MNMVENRLEKWLQLTLTPGIGPRTFHRLIERFSLDPETVLQAPPSQLSALGVNEQILHALRQPQKAAI